MQRTRQHVPRQSLSCTQARLRLRSSPHRPAARSYGRGLNVPRATQRRGSPWLVTFCAIGLLTLVAQTPRLSIDTLAAQSMRVVSGAARLAVKVPDTISLLVEPHATHQYWQVGVMADAAGTHASGMRTRIVTRLPQRIGTATTNYFWIGSYLSDGSFIQIGYWVPWYDSAHAGWFYCAFDSGWHKGPCVYGTLGTAGSDSTSHTYALEAVAGDASASGSPAVWRAVVDGQSAGEFRWTAGETGTNAPAIYAESSGFAPHGSSSQLGPVDFAGGIETRAVGRLGYATVAGMTAAYSAANVCPPYGIALDGHDGVLLGSGLACPDRYGEL